MQTCFSRDTFVEMFSTAAREIGVELILALLVPLSPIPLDYAPGAYQIFIHRGEV